MRVGELKSEREDSRKDLAEKEAECNEELAKKESKCMRLKDKLKDREQELKLQRNDYDSLLGDETLNLTDRSVMEAEVAK